ncbi:hypothetical protein [Streptomyces chrestomyceticus]|uniref:hypothetical protein n=1 Tax=Streptomyces chrestomyceticus TaxID=68185 RepID=UPI0033D639F0
MTSVHGHRVSPADAKLRRRRGPAGLPRPALAQPAPCNPRPALAEVLDLALREGPARDAHHSGETVAPGDLAQPLAHWHEFTALARRAGYTHAAAVPLRLRRQSLGALLLLSTTPGPCPPPT